MINPGNVLQRRPNPSALSHAETVGEVARELVFSQTVLTHAVAVAHGDRPVGERVVVDHDARRRTDLVLTAIELADVALVVLRAEERPQAAFDALRTLDQFGLVARQRQDADLDRRDLWMETQHDALRLFAGLRVDGRLVLVGVD